MSRRDLFPAFIVGLIAIGLGFLYALVGTLLGAVCGWILSLTPLDALIKNGVTQFGFRLTNLVEVGGALGFIGGFFRAVQTNSNK